MRGSLFLLLANRGGVVLSELLNVWQEFSIKSQDEAIFIGFTLDHVHAHEKIDGRNNSVAFLLVYKHLESCAVVLHGFNEAINKGLLGKA